MSKRAKTTDWGINPHARPVYALYLDSKGRPVVTVSAPELLTIYAPIIAKDINDRLRGTEAGKRRAQAHGR